jgi:hypothetical protein
VSQIPTEKELLLQIIRTDPKANECHRCGLHGDEQQEFYAQATSYLALTKDAWRNHAMHVRGKNTQDEAELIFESVKAFMQKLATRLHE